MQLRILLKQKFAKLSINGMYIASGHEVIGITESPITGKLFSQLVTGHPPKLSLEELALSRFQKPA